MNYKKLLILMLSAILLLGSYGCKKEVVNNKTPGSDTAISNPAERTAEKSISNSYGIRDVDIIHEKYMAEQYGWVYYFNDDDKNCLYKKDTDGTKKTYVSNIMVQDIQVDGEWIYYTISANGIYRMKVNGTENRQLASGNNSIGSFKVSGSWMVLISRLCLRKL